MRRLPNRARAAILQHGNPVAFASKRLTKTEQCYPSIEKETLAILYACRKFDQFLCGKVVRVESDHRPLQLIFKKPLLSAPRRLQWMLLSLQRYHLDVQYKCRKDMWIADILSRTTSETEESENGLQGPKEVYEFQINELFQNISAIDQLPIADMLIRAIQREVDQDQVCQKLKSFIANGWPQDNKKVEAEVKPFWKYRQFLTYTNSLILMEDRVFIPSGMRSDMINRLHRSHQGIEATLKLAKDTMFLPKMTTNIKNRVRNCDMCIQHSEPRIMEPMQTHAIPKLPFNRVTKNVLEFRDKDIGKKHYFLVTADYYSDFFELDESTAAQHIVHA